MNGDGTTNHEDTIEGLPTGPAAPEPSVTIARAPSAASGYSLTANEALQQMAAEQPATTIQPVAHPQAVDVTQAMGTETPVQQVVTAPQTTTQATMHPPPPMPTPTLSEVPQVAPMAVGTNLATLIGAELHGAPRPEVPPAPAMSMAQWEAKPICLMPCSLHPYAASPLSWVRLVPDPVQTMVPVRAVPGAPPCITYKQTGVEYENCAFPNCMINGGASGFMTGPGGLPPGGVVFQERPDKREESPEERKKRIEKQIKNFLDDLSKELQGIVKQTAKEIAEAKTPKDKKAAADRGKKALKDKADAAKKKNAKDANTSKEHNPTRAEEIDKLAGEILRAIEVMVEKSIEQVTEFLYGLSKMQDIVDQTKSEIEKAKTLKDKKAAADNGKKALRDNADKAKKKIADDAKIDKERRPTEAKDIDEEAKEALRAIEVQVEKRTEQVTDMYTITKVITVERTDEGKGATIGNLDVREKGAAEPEVTGKTLEPKKGTYDLKEGAGEKTYPIPAGEYAAEMHKSRKGKAVHGNRVVLLNNVVGFDMIEIHVGCFIGDTTGCILPGSRHTVQADGTSRVWDSTDKVGKILACIDRERKKAEDEHKAFKIEVVIKDAPKK